MPNDWMIYGREKGKGRYRPFDGQGFTNNLIYALRFHPDEGNKVNQVISQLNHDNPGFEFEARRGKGSIYGDGPKEKRNTRTEPITRTMGDATITADKYRNAIGISFRVDIPDELRVYLMDNDFRSDREGHWTNTYDDYNLEVAGIAADLLIRYQDEQERNRPKTAPMRQGDLAIYGRQRNIGRFRPFDGKELGTEPIRWPFSMRPNVINIAESLEHNNPSLEFEVRQLPDTIFDDFLSAEEEMKLQRRHLHDLTVPTPHWGAFDRPSPQDGARSLDTFPDEPTVQDERPSLDYSTQLFGMEIVTSPMKGRRTPSNKCKLMDSTITEIAGGNVSILKSTISKNVYYAVLEACNPDLRTCQKILVMGKVLDDPDGGIRTHLLQSDTGSPFLDCPRSYLSILDDPRTEQDEIYRSKVLRRFEGDGRPWDERKYTIGGTEYDAFGMVQKVSDSTGLTPWGVQTTRDIRAMRVYDEVDVNGTKLIRVFNRRGRSKR